MYEQYKYLLFVNKNAYLTSQLRLHEYYCNKKKKFHIGQSKDPIVQLYADADFACDKSRKSTSGFLIKYNSSLVQWTSNLQSTIAESSAEAELRSLTEGAHDARFLTQLESELFKKPLSLIHSYEDNTAVYEQCVSSNCVM